MYFKKKITEKQHFCDSEDFMLLEVGVLYGFTGKKKELRGLVSLRGTGRDEISMQFDSRDFRPCWF